MGGIVSCCYRPDKMPKRTVIGMNPQRKTFNTKPKGQRFITPRQSHIRDIMRGNDERERGIPT